jgi:hypothetical protein
MVLEYKMMITARIWADAYRAAILETVKEGGVN